jgi:hypothetical protein
VLLLAGAVGCGGDEGEPYSFDLPEGWEQRGEAEERTLTGPGGATIRIARVPAEGGLDDYVGTVQGRFEQEGWRSILGVQAQSFGDEAGRWIPAERRRGQSVTDRRLLVADHAGERWTMDLTARRAAFFDAFDALTAIEESWEWGD